MLQAQYYKKAVDAYRENELKLSIIYLKKLENWNTESVDLLVNSAYNLWKQRIVTENGIISNDEEAAIAVQDAFAMLLSGGDVSHDSIQPWNYIRLSHLYLVEGNLRGAVEIMNIASNRGYLEDILIVTQTCFIMWAMNNNNEVTRIMTFLRSALCDLSASLKANEASPSAYRIADGLLPLSTLFLLCATRLQYEAKPIKSKKAKSKMMKEFHDLLREAYFYEFCEFIDDFTPIMQWYDDSTTWQHKADTLDNTPLFLLSQALYYESFTRNSLSSLEISHMVASMKRFGQQDDIPRIMSNALQINCWNIFCRNTMTQCELKYVKLKEDRHWTKLFANEEFELTKIQNVFRGYTLRKWWPAFRDQRLQVLAHFAEQMYVAQDRYDMYYHHYHGVLWSRWRQYIYDWKMLKKYSSTRIQTCWRRKLNVMKYQVLKLRVARANQQYLITCQHLFDIKRIQTMRAWYDYYLHRRRHASAAILADVLFLNGYNQLLVKGMNMVLSILRIRYKYLRKLSYSYWRERFQLRQKQHAKFTIRFFIRDQRRKVKELQEEIALQEIETIIAQKIEKANFVKDFTPFMREYWIEWRKKYEDKNKHRAVIRAVFTLQRTFRCKKARPELIKRRTKREAQYAYLRRSWYLSVVKILRPWQVNAAARVIQRASRCRQAQKALRRLQNIFIIMRQRLHEKVIQTKQNMVKRWCKYMFLWHREKLRALKWVRHAFQRVLLKSRLKRIHHRKTANYKILDATHRSFLRGIFVFIRDRIKHEIQVRSMQKLTHLFSFFYLRQNFQRLQKQCFDQSLLVNLLRMQVGSRIDKLFWHGARLSVEIASFRASRSSMSFITSTKDVFMPWERRVYNDKILLDVRSMSMIKSFRVWMAMYRRRQQFKHQGAFLIAHELYDQLLIKLQLRADANIRIQSQCRQLLSRKRIHFLRAFHIRAQELQQKVEIKLAKLYFSKMHELMHKRKKLLPKVVHCFRRVVAVQKLDFRRHEQSRLNEAERTINSSLFRRCLVENVIKQWLLLYADRVLRLDLDEDEFLERRHRRRAHNKKSMKSNQSFAYYSQDDNDIDQQDESDLEFDNHASSLRMKKIERYQQRQQLVEMKLTRHKQKLRSVKLQSNVTKFPSSTALFFRSESFHVHWQNVKVQQIFYFNANVLKQLQEQEIYFILQFTSTVVVQEMNNSKLMQMVCNAFKGNKLIITSLDPSHNKNKAAVEVVQKYLIDFLTDRSLYEEVLIDRGKWPLTILPQQQQAPPTREEAQALSVYFEQTTITHHALVLLIRALAFHSQRVNIRNLEMMENNQIRLLTHLAFDVEAFGWFGVLLSCMALTSYPYLQTLTIRLSNIINTTVDMPEYMMSAMQALAKFPALASLRIIGITPCIWLQALTTCLEDNESFTKLERLDLLINEADRTIGRTLTDRAKMRCYSVVQQGLSVYIDEI